MQTATQKHFDDAFASITFEQSIALLIGDQHLNEKQQHLMELATSDPTVPGFTPLPVGYIGFQLRGHDKFFKRGKLFIIPGNDLIRARVNKIRRSILADELKVSQETADYLFTEVHGWQPAIDDIIIFYNVFKSNPSVTDETLKVIFAIRNWKDNQKRAVRALRSLLKTVPIFHPDTLCNPY